MTQKELEKEILRIYEQNSELRSVTFETFGVRKILYLINQHVKEVIGEKELYRNARMNGIAAAIRDALKEEQLKRAGL